MACWSAWPWATGLFLSMWPRLRHVTSLCQGVAAALGLSGAEDVKCQGHAGPTRQVAAHVLVGKGPVRSDSEGRSGAD